MLDDATTIRLALLAALAATLGCNEILGIEPGQPLATTSSGAAGGAGGAGGEGGEGGAAGFGCPSFVGEAPADCAGSGYLSDEDNCCVPERSCLGGPCVDGRCTRHNVANSPMDDIVDVLVIDDQVFWSTGYNSELYVASKTGGAATWLATDPTYYLTRLATDGDYVYWAQYNGPEIKRVPVEGGDVEIVSTVPISGATADFGAIVVDANTADAFWSTFEPTAGGAGIWMADTYGADPEAQRVAETTGSLGVAVDDEHVYWTDCSAGVVQRLSRSLIGSGDPPETLATEQQGAATIVIDDERVYWTTSSGVYGMPKAGGTVFGFTTEDDPFALVVDDAYLYWTNNAGDGAGQVRRALKDGSGSPVTLAGADAPRGMTQECDALYFCENDNDDSEHYIAVIAK